MSVRYRSQHEKLPHHFQIQDSPAHRSVVHLWGRAMSVGKCRYPKLCRVSADLISLNSGLNLQLITAARRWGTHCTAFIPPGDNAERNQDSLAESSSLPNKPSMVQMWGAISAQRGFTHRLGVRRRLGGHWVRHHLLTMIRL
jgi:hypothetical protein